MFLVNKGVSIRVIHRIWRSTPTLLVPFEIRPITHSIEMKESLDKFKNKTVITFIQISKSQFKRHCKDLVDVLCPFPMVLQTSQKLGFNKS